MAWFYFTQPKEDAARFELVFEEEWTLLVDHSDLEVRICRNSDGPFIARGTLGYRKLRAKTLEEAKKEALRLTIGTKEAELEEVRKLYEAECAQ